MGFPHTYGTHRFHALLHAVYHEKEPKDLYPSMDGSVAKLDIASGFKSRQNQKRLGTEEARQAHNLKVVGSKPTVAIIPLLVRMDTIDPIEHKASRTERLKRGKLFR